MTASVRRAAFLFRHPRWMAGAMAVVSAACGDKTPESAVAPVENGTLEAGVVARVGTERIFADDVARIASSQGISVAVARDLAIRDALYAMQGKAEGLDVERNEQLIVNAALARRMLRKMLDDADRAGAVTDEELERVMKRRWLELDRPEGFRVVHAVVRTKEDVDEATLERAKIVARAVREAVIPVADMASKTAWTPDAPDPVVDAFKRAVDAVARDGFEIKVEALDPVAADGRVLSMSGGGYEKPFAEGAAKLEARGALSEMVVSHYGVHVLLLLERIPEARVPVDERRKLVREEVLWMRASEERKKLLERLRPSALVGREVETLLVTVPVGG
ncbi:MAG TPA: peptidylprolyl isomerase [Polyangium sp.]|nr:peptidylprolyl isomerase [Polyangium sp.]